MVLDGRWWREEEWLHTCMASDGRGVPCEVLEGVREPMGMR